MIQSKKVDTQTYTHTHTAYSAKVPINCKDYKNTDQISRLQYCVTRNYKN